MESNQACGSPKLNSCTGRGIEEWGVQSRLASDRPEVFKSIALSKHHRLNRHSQNISIVILR